MIKPYYQDEHASTIVEVEDHGIIDLSKLPIRLQREGRYEIGWVTSYINGKSRQELSEYGGYSSFDFGGRPLGVLKEIE